MRIRSLWVDRHLLDPHCGGKGRISAFSSAGYCESELAGAFAAAPPRSLAAGASPWPAPPPYSPRATLHTGSPFRYSPSTVPLKKLVKPKKAVDMVEKLRIDSPSIARLCRS